MTDTTEPDLIGEVIPDSEHPDPKIRAAHEKLVKQLEADPDSTQGTFSEHPAAVEAREAAERFENLTDLERTEIANGFRFGDPDNEATAATPTRTVICRNPACSNNGAQIAVHPDTAQPIHCGGTITDPTGATSACYAVLLCDHEPVTTETTTGTLAAPVKTTTTACPKCNTILNETTEPLPPINLGTLPTSILNTPLGTAGNIGFDATDAAGSQPV